MVEGTFTPDSAARSLSKAKLFMVPTAKVLGRFSDFTGIPTIPDNIEGASPRGMAVKFSVPGESDVDVVMHNFNGFPTRTSAEFRELLLAVAASGKNAPKPTPLDTFLASHPIAKTFLTTQKSPESFATSAFFGVNSIKFTNPQGQPTFVRYQFIPAAGEHYLDAAALQAKDANYLQSEIGQRSVHCVAAHAQVGQAGCCEHDRPRAGPGQRGQEDPVSAREPAGRLGSGRPYDPGAQRVLPDLVPPPPMTDTAINETTTLRKLVTPLSMRLDRETATNRRRISPPRLSRR